MRFLRGLRVFAKRNDWAALYSRGLIQAALQYVQISEEVKHHNYNPINYFISRHFAIFLYYSGFLRL